MKKVLSAMFALYLMVPSSYGQDDEIRPPALGISFFLSDFKTANLIRTTSLNAVLRDKKWTKLSQLTPGIAINYFKGLKKHIDFAGVLGGSFPDYSLPDKPSTSNKFLLEANALLNFKLTTEKYWLQPYAIAGIGAHKFGSYYGAFIPLGLGLKVNFFDEAHLFFTSQYRVPVTTETANYHFQHSIGVAGILGKKKEPKVIPPPPPPPPVDTDGDGIPDDKDKCPTVPGVAKYDGCPVPDTDKDGINDDDDKCPTVPGLARYQGCPIPDTDKDGINDEEDKCPKVPGPVENLGCPVIGIQSYEIVFKINSATLLPKGKETLDTVVNYLKRNADVNVTIDGHTDITGSDKINDPLSVRRAESAKAYLVSKGIEASRLTTAGYGSKQPIEDNGTAEGRRKNRRVEIKIKP